MILGWKNKGIRKFNFIAKIIPFSKKYLILFLFHKDAAGLGENVDLIRIEKVVLIAGVVSL